MVERTIEVSEHEDSPTKHNNTNSKEQGPGHTGRIAVPKGAAARGSMIHLLGARSKELAGAAKSPQHWPLILAIHYPLSIAASVLHFTFTPTSRTTWGNCGSMQDITYYRR